jgi:hypothetical protein
MTCPHTSSDECDISQRPKGLFIISLEASLRTLPVSVMHVSGGMTIKKL